MRAGKLSISVWITTPSEKVCRTGGRRGRPHPSVQSFAGQGVLRVPALSCGIRGTSNTDCHKQVGSSDFSRSLPQNRLLELFPLLAKTKQPLAGALSRDHGVDADHVGVAVEQGPTAVAAIDRSFGLKHVLTLHAVEIGDEEF